MKNNRLKTISELIKTRSINTQEELLACLKEKGYNVTQATISRDIKELRLSKVTLSDGTTKYSIPADNKSDEFTEKFKTIFRESVISVKNAGNIVVIKCYTGLGNAACAALDSMNFEHLVGTIAGDDTIFGATESPEDALLLVEKLANII